MSHAGSAGAFDSVRMMRELRDELDRQVAEMTPEERVAFINGNAERARTARKASTRAA